MTETSTTIRVRVSQRERLRELARRRSSTMSDTLDAALTSLRRELFFEEMAAAEADLGDDPVARERYTVERDSWLNAELG